VKAEVRDACPSDIQAILSDLRDADAAEMAALGTTAERALTEGMAISAWTGTGVVDGTPVCMFGVAPFNVLNGIGAPWMLSANGLTRARKPFLKACPRILEMMLEDYPRLANIVDTRNTQAIRWLRWMGFRIHDDTIPLNGVIFNSFSAGEW